MRGNIGGRRRGVALLEVVLGLVLLTALILGGVQLSRGATDAVVNREDVSRVEQEAITLDNVFLALGSAEPRLGDVQVTGGSSVRFREKLPGGFTCDGVYAMGAGAGVRVAFETLRLSAFQVGDSVVLHLSDGRVLRAPLPRPATPAPSCSGLADFQTVALPIPGLVRADSLVVPENQRVDVVRTVQITRRPGADGGVGFTVTRNGVSDVEVPGPYLSAVLVGLDSLGAVTTDSSRIAMVQVVTTAWLLKDRARVAMPTATRTYRTAALPAGWNVMPGKPDLTMASAVCVDPAAANQFAVGPCIYGTAATVSLVLPPVGTPSNYIAPMPVSAALVAGTLPGEGALQPGSGAWSIVGKGSIAKLTDSTAGFMLAADADSGDVLTITYAGTMTSGRGVSATASYTVEGKRPLVAGCALGGGPPLYGFANAAYIHCDASVRAVGIASMTVTAAPFPASTAPITDAGYPALVGQIVTPDQCGGTSIPGEYPVAGSATVVVTALDGRTFTVTAPFTVCVPYR